MMETAISRAEINPFWHIRGANEKMDKYIDNFMNNNLKETNMEKKVRRSKKNKKNMVCAGDGILNKIENILDVMLKDIQNEPNSAPIALTPEADKEVCDTMMNTLENMFGNKASADDYNAREVNTSEHVRYAKSSKKYANPALAASIRTVLEKVEEAMYALNTVLLSLTDVNEFDVDTNNLPKESQIKTHKTYTLFGTRLEPVFDNEDLHD